MNTYSPEFYNPLALALNGAKLQDFVDEVLEGYNVLDIEGFKWNNDLLPDFNYAQVQRELKMDVMASYVDLDSPAIPVGTEGSTLATGRIPRQKAVEYYNEDKLRKLWQMEDSRSIEREAIVRAAGVGLGEIILKLVSRHTNSISFQRNQVVSQGFFELTDTNNPNGIQNVKFANHTPAANYLNLTGAKRWWTAVADGVYSTPGAQCDPIGDLKNMVKIARLKVRTFHIEVNKNYFDQVLEHPKVKAAIAARLYPMATDATMISAAMGVRSRDELKGAFEAIVGCPVVEKDFVARVEKWDATKKGLTYPTMDGFADNVLVIVPDGNIGEILTVRPILLEGGEYAFGYDGKLAITIGKDYVKKCQSYNSEMTSLVVPDKPQYMWYIHPYADR